MRRVLLACASALLMASCGGTEHTVASAPYPTDSGPGGAGSVELSIRGVNAQSFGSVSLRIERVSVIIDGIAASVATRETALELASGTPMAAASFSLPESASTVHVAISVASAGDWKGAAGSGPIDARGLPISFDATATTVLRRGTVRIDLDVGTSLQPAGDSSMVLLPNSAIFF